MIGNIIWHQSGKLVKPSHKFGFEPIAKFKRGVKVLYYVGPQRGMNGKWRQRWTGPWRIDNKCGQYRVTIIDNQGKIKEVSFDRLKIFKQSEEKDYLNYEQYLKTLNRLSMDDINLSDDEL